MDTAIDEKTLAHKGLALRSVESDDLPAALALSSQAGWNQLPGDWAIFLDHGNVYGLFTADRKLIATAATLAYQPSFAWISMVLVDESWRRQGLATFLLRKCLRDLEEQGRAPVLDATEAGSAVYRKLGFVIHNSLSRMHSPRPVPLPIEPGPDALRLAPWRPEILPKALSWDTSRFGGNRDFILSAFAKSSPKLAWTLRLPNGSLSGYALGRAGRRATQFGPLCATSDEGAAALLNQLVSQSEGPTYLDVPQQRSSFIRLLLDHGWSEERSFLRMSTAADGDFSRLDDIYGIAGPELG